MATHPTSLTAAIALEQAQVGNEGGVALRSVFCRLHAPGNSSATARPAPPLRSVVANRSAAGVSEWRCHDDERATSVVKPTIYQDPSREYLVPGEVGTFVD